jgi:hypothetical protein
MHLFDVEAGHIPHFDFLLLILGMRLLITISESQAKSRARLLY